MVDRVRDSSKIRIYTMSTRSKILQKTVMWRILSFSLSLTMARIWFGDWHVTGFSCFLTVFMMVVYYIFERIYVGFKG